MTRNHRGFWFFCALALPGSAMLGWAQEMKPDGVAVVRAVHGMAQYSNGDQWLDAKPNLQFVAGTTLRTGADSVMDLRVNGTVSSIRLEAQTTAQLQRMARASAETSADTETILDLKSGTLLGSVKKLSAKSLYQIHTPDGTAAVRGTDFEIEALQQADGSVHTKFSCIGGELFCSAVVNGQTVSNPSERAIPGRRVSRQMGTSGHRVRKAAARPTPRCPPCRPRKSKPCKSWRRIMILLVSSF